MADFKQTPSQTVGPYFAYGLTAKQYGYPQTSIAEGVLAGDDTEGERITLIGRVLDGEGKPIPDAMVEIWQADAQGRYAHTADPRGSNSTFVGFGRLGTGTDPQNRFLFQTVKPGAVGDGQAPHITLILFMRGLLTHLYTRVYFSDEADANAADPVLAAVSEDRRDTLVAAREDGAQGVVYRIDIHMQGPCETVFFDA
ncbi:MAG: protocatechuate 3,4-dioxygenase subunit alpha [Alphaproteobacteria bacterium]|nr:protocatechuate 3,4-dioxygenase subunit alpha [Alphaproteobacteria bacterium]